MILTSGGPESADLLPILANLGVTTIDRPYDGDAVRLVGAIKPALAVLVCSTADSTGRAMISAVAREGVDRLLVVNADVSPEGTVAALELGADAVISRSAETEMLRATLVALMRRVAPRGPVAKEIPASSRVRVGDLVIDHDVCEAREGDSLIALTRTEFRILDFLAANVGKVQSPQRIMAEIHDYQFTAAEAQQTIKVYVRRIRRKFEAFPWPSVEIVNARSFGYRLQPTLNRLSAGNVAA
jgi:DNA-binding response OmpR family regulator